MGSVLDFIFWQYPCITEGSAAEASSGNFHFYSADSPDFFNYISIPWATWIDLFADSNHHPHGSLLLNYQIRMWASVSALSFADISFDRSKVRLVSVCQHVYWQKAIPWFTQIGLTDVFLSHCPLDESQRYVDGIRLHPWHLFATNVETPERAVGIVHGKPNSEKSFLASFIGAHADHYVSDHRRRLAVLKGIPGFHIEIKNEWHFNKQVYEYQLKGKHDFPLVLDEESVLQYNTVLSDSVFSLCPAGAGANTIRFWESLAVGAIPVVIGPRPALPLIGPDLGCKWEDAIVYFDGDHVESLPAFLRSFSGNECSERQQLCMKIYSTIVSRAPEQALALYI